MSTCLSSPFCSFFTFTLQAGRSRAARVASPTASVLTICDLVLRMWRPSFGDLCRAFETGAALGNIRNGDGQMAANRNLPEERFDRAHLRHGRIGKRTHAILDLGEIAG